MVIGCCEPGGCVANADIVDLRQGIEISRLGAGPAQRRRAGAQNVLGCAECAEQFRARSIAKVGANQAQPFVAAGVGGGRLWGGHGSYPRAATDSGTVGYKRQGAREGRPRRDRFVANDSGFTPGS